MNPPGLIYGLVVKGCTSDGQIVIVPSTPPVRVDDVRLEPPAALDALVMMSN